MKPFRPMRPKAFRLSTPVTRLCVRRSGSKYRVALRREVIAAFGGACTCCHEAIFEFLTLEHLNNDGAAHRRQVGKNAQAQLLDIKKRGFPPEYTVLCFSCNLAKGIHGTCPHTWPEYQRDVTPNLSSFKAEKLDEAAA